MESLRKVIGLVLVEVINEVKAVKLEVEATKSTQVWVDVSTMLKIVVKVNNTSIIIITFLIIISSFSAFSFSIFPFLFNFSISFFRNVLFLLLFYYLIFFYFMINFNFFQLLEAIHDEQEQSKLATGPLSPSTTPKRPVSAPVEVSRVQQWGSSPNLRNTTNQNLNVNKNFSLHSEDKVAQLQALLLGSIDTISTNLYNLKNLLETTKVPEIVIKLSQMARNMKKVRFSINFLEFSENFPSLLLDY